MIVIDYKDARPLYEQIADKFKHLILKGVLEQDSKLPSVRNLAMDLSINPNTIQRAYERLEQMGYIYVIKGRGNFVSHQESLREEQKKELLCQINSLLIEAKECGLRKEDALTYIEALSLWKE